MSLLPEELSCAQEEFCGFRFPPDDVAPLVDFYGQVSPASDPLGESRVHYRFGRGSYGEFFLQWSVPAVGNPCDFRDEPFKVFSFFFQEAFGYEHGEVDVAVACLLDFLVKNLLYFLPDGVSVFAYDHAALDGRVICHSRLHDDLRVPLGEVLTFLDGYSSIRHSQLSHSVLHWLNITITQIFAREQLARFSKRRRRNMFSPVGLASGDA